MRPRISVCRQGADTCGSHVATRSSTSGTAASDAWNGSGRGSVEQTSGKVGDAGIARRKMTFEPKANDHMAEVDDLVTRSPLCCKRARMRQGLAGTHSWSAQRCICERLKWLLLLCSGALVLLCAG